MSVNQGVRFQINDKGYDGIVKQLMKLDNYQTVAGFPEDGKKTTHKSGFNVASLALVNEYGRENGRIPARPFMAQTAAKFQLNVGNLTEALTKQIASGVGTARKAHGKMGAYYEGKMKETITNGNYVANAPATIKLKGSSRPLIDTGQMRASVTHKVRKVVKGIS